MAKFVYRMQNILDLKQKLEEQEKANFGLAVARYNEEQQKLRDIMVRQAGYEKHLKDISIGDIDIKEIRSCKSAIAAMKVALRSQLIEVSKARKMHEKLREHAFEEFLDEIDREESKITDELVSYTYFNNSSEDD